MSYIADWSGRVIPEPVRPCGHPRNGGECRPTCVAETEQHAVFLAGSDAVLAAR